MAVTTPAIPASGTAQANTTGQNVSVALTGGTVTSVTVTTAAGVSSTVATSSPASYDIPPGGSHTITYSAAPAQAWTDPLDLGYTPGPAAENTSTTDNPLADMPYPAHAEGGEPGLGEGVSN
jgi:hypothetical protein